MNFYKSYPPVPALTGLIREFQVHHVVWEDQEQLPPPFITCLANTEQNLYFYPHDPIKIVPAEGVEIPAPRVVVTGPKYKPVGLLYGRDHLMIKIAFHPTGTYRLLGIDMQKTVNSGLDATTIWGPESLTLLHELGGMTAYDDMIGRISSFLEQKSELSCRPQEAIDLVAIQMLDALQNNSLEEWAARACLSLRQFERNFLTRVGISPKLFIRIVRFEYAMKLKNEYPEKSWSAIAIESGYTDSSHLLREFREFAEFPPGQFYLKPTSGYSSFPTG